MSTGLIFMNDALVRRDLWIPITIRVAWELHLAKIEVRPNILRAACLHSLCHLDADISVEEAEKLASVYTADFISRISKRQYNRVSIESEEIEFTEEWRKLMLKNLKPVEQKIFWFIYSDGLSPRKTARKMGISTEKLEAYCQKIRLCMRRVAAKEEIAITDWSDNRLDKSIRVIANIASSFDFNIEDIRSKKGKKLIQKCPRIRRAYLLMKHGVISERDLEIPTENELIERQNLLVLMLHPDKKKQAKFLSECLGEYATQIEADAWLIDEDDVEDVEAILVELAKESSPAKQFLRGSLVSGPGEWYDDILLGPLPIRCLDAVRSRPWGAIDGISELPQPLPPPPKATMAWAVAAFFSALSVSSLAWALQPIAPEELHRIDAEFEVSRESVDARFDVSDAAYITVVRMNNGILSIDEEYSSATKGVIATGDGRFYLRVDAPEIAVISSNSPILELKSYLLTAQTRQNPLEELKIILSEAFSDVDIVLSPKPEAY